MNFWFGHDRVFSRFMFAIVCFCLLMLYAPVLTMIVQSLTDASSESGLSLRWYKELGKDHALLESLGRSAFVGICSGLLSTLLGLFSGVALYRSSFLVRSVIQLTSAVALAVPELILALALLVQFSFLSFDLGLTTVILAHATLTLPYSTLVVSARVATLNPEIEQVARDLGANEWQILRSITIPLLSPSLFSALALCFLVSFDDFLITYFVNGVGQDTLPVKLYTSMKAGQSPKLHALAVTLLLCTMVIAGPLVFRLARDQREE